MSAFEEWLKGMEAQLSSLADAANNLHREVMFARDEHNSRILDNRQLSLAQTMRRNIAADNLP